MVHVTWEATASVGRMDGARQTETRWGVDGLERIGAVKNREQNVVETAGHQYREERNEYA